MAVQRFVLDSTTLDNAGFGLDGGAAFILDTSTLDSAAVLDGGEFLTVATGSSSLGGLSASASAQSTVFPVLSSSLGGLDATATARATIFPVLSSSLGGLDATASASAIIFPVFDAPLDGLVASATATVIPPEPTPEPIPSGGRQYAAPRRKKIEPLPEVEIPVIQPKRRYAVASATLNGMQAQAVGTITFSILDDDAEVLLLV